MSLGICCHYLSEEVKPKSGKKFYVNSMDEKTLQLGRYRQGKYSDETIKSTYVHNVKMLAEMLPKVFSSGVRLFRISSAMFPLADQVEESLWKNEDVVGHLAEAGKFIRDNDMRVSCHPGQFCVISSDSDSVVEKSFTELNIHGWMFDEMGLERSPKYAINIHGGKSNRIERLSEQILRLPEKVRNRLTLENDESAYNVIDLLQVYRKTGVPIVFDSHHHTFNDGELSMDEAFDLSQKTWQGVRPLQHISNTEPLLKDGNFMDRRKHSDMIHYVPECQLHALRENSIDVEVEAKLKNVAVFEMSQKFNIPL